MPQLEDNVTSEYSFRTVQPETSTEGGQAPSTTFDRELPDLIQLGRTINMYGSVIVLVIGVVGNLLTLVVMRRSSFKKSTSSIFFSNLAIADLFHLFDYLTGRWFAAHKGWDVWEAWGDFACKMKRVSYLFGINWPAWIVVAMTFERVLVVLFPLKAKVWLTRRNAHVTCACIAIFFFVLWTVLILMWGVSSGRCRLKEVLTFLQDYGYPLATTLYTYVPTPLLILMNGVLIHQLVKVRLTQKKMTNSTVREQAMDKGLTRVTIMAILVSVTYLFLTLPSMIIAYLDSMIDMSQYGNLQEPLFHLNFLYS